ncbi:MAG: ATP-binding protein [Polyangiaceae bacterium]
MGGTTTWSWLRARRGRQPATIVMTAWSAGSSAGPRVRWPWTPTAMIDPALLRTCALAAEGIPAPPSSRPQGRVLMVDIAAELGHIAPMLAEAFQRGARDPAQAAAPPDGSADVAPAQPFELLQGDLELAVRRVIGAREQGQSFAVAVVGVGSAPAPVNAGVVSRLLAADADLQIVLCMPRATPSAAGLEVVEHDARVVMLPTPVAEAEVLLAVRNLLQKWDLLQQVAQQRAILEAVVELRTAEMAAVNTELVEDIMRREAAEAALAASERRFRTLASRAPVGIFESEADGNWTYANERCLDVVPCDGESGVRPSLLTSVHPDDAAALCADWQRSLQDLAELQSEHRYVTADGHTVWASVTALPERDDAGKLTGWIGTISDVSERKLREMQLTLADRLTSMGTLAAGLAHEINNPLAYLIVNLEMALEQLAGDRGEVVEMLADAHNGAERVRELVAQLKTFSRVDEAEARVPVSMVPLIDASLKMTSNQIRHRAKLSCDLGTVPQVLGDQGRLAQVVVNLLVNATQALPADGESNEIHVSARASSSGEAVIEVRDNGCGIPGPILSRIFDPFFTTKRVGEGTGLGLSICHNIVTSHGGRLEVESEVGRGTVFRVTLPGLAPLTVAAPADGPKGAQVRTAAKVLIVDDEAHLGSALRRSLGGHEVDVVRSGAEALRRLEQSGYDMVLCDLMMPGMSGMQLFARIQRSWPSLAKRVVFMTGGAFTPETQAFLEEAPNARVLKPFDLGELRTLVSRHAGRMTLPPRAG